MWPEMWTLGAKLEHRKTLHPRNPRARVRYDYVKWTWSSQSSKNRGYIGSHRRLVLPLPHHKIGSSKRRSKPKLSLMTITVYNYRWRQTSPITVKVWNCIVVSSLQINLMNRIYLGVQLVKTDWNTLVLFDEFDLQRTEVLRFSPFDDITEKSMSPPSQTLLDCHSSKGC